MTQSIMLTGVRPSNSEAETEAMAADLARDLTGRFGDHAYAMEELVAELGAAFLCADLAIANVPRADHAAYIANWLEVLRSDKRAVFTAASKASSASDYLFSLQPKRVVP